MPASLPVDLITKLKPIILPYVRDKDDREALFIDTYFLRDPRPLDQISFEGSPEVFASRCIADLLKKIGCLAEDGDAVTPEHSLAALLQTIRTRCGVEKHAEIDRWLPILNDQCAAPSIEPATPAPVSAPAQTIDTPISERAASVFISYSHTNETFANELITALGEHGHRCWIDTSKIKGGADWQRAICDGINLSYALVVVCTRKALESEYVWDEIQWARTRHKLIIPVLLEDVTDDDRFFGLHRYQGIRFDKLARSQAVAALIAALPTPPSGDAPARPLTQREHELAYLDRLRFEDFRLERFELAEYTALPGEAQTRREVRDSWAALAMEQEFAVIRQAKRDADEIDSPPEKFTDAVSKITELRRVVVLGEPGAGKTHTLRAIAKPLYVAALSDASAPIPLLVKLGNWDKPDMPFEAFLREALGELGAHLDDLFAAQRAILLLDGLNEFPADQRAAKYPQVEAFIKAHPDVMAVVTCREADYPISLHLSRVLIRPLDPLRIRDFARRALKGVETTDVFFWKLVGAEARRFETRFKGLFAETLPNWESVFWLADALPAGAEWKQEFINGWWTGWDRWKALRDNPAAILTLARNPYMLRMLLDVYIQSKGELPSNRGQLFGQFVNVLLGRERLVNKDTGELTKDGQALLAGLQRIAYDMQIRRAGTAEDGEASAGTSLDLAAVRGILNERLLYLAVSTSILTTGDEVRFSHQLLQEYFAARYMEGEITAGRLKAVDIWKPDTWWERTNWEEAAILLAGLYSDDCTPVLNWLADANPEAAALCIARSGATTPETTKTRLRDQWLPRLTDLKHDPQPEARAAVGRALGLFQIDGRMADNRKGVGLRADGLPDLDWVDIPAGEFIYGEGKTEKRLKLPRFSMTRYLVTYEQFGAFLAAADGFYNPVWWEGLAAGDAHKAQPGDQAFKYGNHPRERVSWYDAVAFTRWLSAKLGYEVRLPTEQQYERSARWTDARMYPYAGKYDPAKANTDSTGIKQTSAVGIFPNGASVEGIHDLSGNVWEWCL
ncbi:MAG: SUMF1/EgtB/PvdO family nonheme iron enzyme, partial [Anaerolinea sp.]|nr:SUMF1/EgtB/PvdO family nonheme iron enzyme [Anaerolinea sp.]